MLFTERGDFEDFHLRVEARVNSVGNSGVFFRVEYGPSSLTSTPNGYEVQIALENAVGKGPSYRTGSLWDLAPVESRLHLPDTWFTMEVIAEGNHIVTKINGKDATSFIDPRRRYSSETWPCNASTRRPGSSSARSRSMNCPRQKRGRPKTRWTDRVQGGRRWGKRTSSTSIATLGHGAGKTGCSTALANPTA
jgi:hypothetical protein